MTDPATVPDTVNPEHDLRGVLRVPAFRKLWTALSLSSFGDWLGLLALTALAPRLAGGGYAEANVAIASVFILRLAPAIVIGPVAGVIADRLDRRWTMVVCDVIRFGLFASIPLVGTLWWLLVATFLIEAASLVWIPAKEATVPNLVPRERLATANQLSLFTTYGSAPVAAAVFSGLSLLSGILDNAISAVDSVDLALFFNAATFLVSALTIVRLTEIPPRTARDADGARPPSVWRTLVEGWSFIGRTRLVRGLVVAMLGAFAAGGAVIGLARTFVVDLGAGEPGYGLLFGTVFVGLAGGMFVGPRVVPSFSRRRLLGISIIAAGLSLALLALIPHMVAAVLITLIIGMWAGIAWVTGYTLLGLEVADELRGRTFAFVQTLVRATLVLVLAVAPLLAAAFGKHTVDVTDAMTLTYNGAAITMLVFGLLASLLGVAAYRQMDDRRGVSLLADLRAAFHHEAVGPPREPRRDQANGFFLALEGGEGVGKSTQARMLSDWLRAKGHEVVVTFEPGGTPVGQRLRTELLGVRSEGAALSARTEALLFAADRAEHVATVIRPALARGAVVVSDRYVDSSIAYQGAGRELEPSDVARISRWATDGLRPDLTVLLDLSPQVALQRVDSPDRLESEPIDFHDRVRAYFLRLAALSSTGYLVIDATLAPEQIAAQLQERLGPMLPLSARELAEQEALDERLRAEEEQRQREEAQAAAEVEELAQRQAAAFARREAAEAAEAAARKAAEAEDRARRAAEERARQQAETQARREAQRLDGPPPAPAPQQSDPPTRPLSLTDELLGVDSSDETIQLPVHKSRDER
ncbi:MAG: dTMP kinase [Sporichthyaceae bacterium]